MTALVKNIFAGPALLSFLIVLVSFNALALDPPHNGVNGYACDSCHDVYSSNPKLMPEGDVSGSAIDDTIFNARCRFCHIEAGDASDAEMSPHSHPPTDYDYGEWTVECWVCHSVHTEQQQNQDIDPNDNEPYGKRIRTRINLGNIIYADETTPKSGWKTVVFKGNNSFVDTDGTGEPTGICQVCHTKTRHWSPKAPEDDDHYAGQNCTAACHSHKNSFTHGGGGHLP